MPRGSPDGPRNPFDPFGPFPGPGGIGPIVVTRRKRRGTLLPGTPTRRSGLPAIPIPIPIPSSPPFPGPTVPAANDAIFRRPPIGTGIGTVVLGGVIGVIIVETGVQVARRVAELKKRRREDEEAAELEGILRRAERVERDRDIKTIPQPSPVEISEKIDGPRPGNFPRPRPEKLPEKLPTPIEIPDVQLPQPVPPPVPRPQPVEIPAPLPVPRPATPGLPAPKPIPGFGVPGPVPVPGTNPFSPPGTFPGSLPRRAPRPRRQPQPQPVGDIFPPPNLTPINAPGVGSMPFSFTSNEPQPETQTDRKCKEVKRRRRRKGKCMEGFYREYPMKTQFEEWREVDCTTRKEDPRPDNIPRDSQGRFI